MARHHHVTCYLLMGGALGIASSAQAEVQVYGTLMEFIDYYHTTGATAQAPLDAPNQVQLYPGINVAGRGRVNAGTSHIGFRGTEDLGHGLKVIWQVENQVNIDGDSLPPSRFATRNSRIGLESARWGTVFAGNWDTPYKVTFLDINPLRGLNPFDNILIGNPGFGVPGTTTQAGRSNGKADAAFNRRQGNSVQYWSPEFYGFKWRAQYAFGEGNAASTERADLNPGLWSASLVYRLNPFSLRYAYEQHKDYFGLSQLGGSRGASLSNGSSKDTGQLLAMDYQFPSTRIGLMVERLSYHNQDRQLGAVNRYQRNAWFALIKQNFGLHDVWLTYGKAAAGRCERVGNADCSTHGLGATQWSLGYIYNLSKRTQLYSAYYGIDNQHSAGYVSVGAPPGSSNPGADSRGVGLGMIHTF